MRSGEETPLSSDALLLSDTWEEPWTPDQSCLKLLWGSGVAAGVCGWVELLGESPTVAVFGDLKHNTLHWSQRSPIWCSRWDSVLPTYNIRTTFTSQHFNFNIWITVTPVNFQVTLAFLAAKVSDRYMTDICSWWVSTSPFNHPCDVVDLRNVLTSFSVEAFHWQGGSKS